MPPSNLRQAERIASAEALPNPIGSAPGWWVDRDGRVTALMPGVPSEMRRMFDEQVAPRLVERFGATPLAVRTVKTFGIGESALAEMLGSLLEEPGAGVTAGIYARDDGVHLRFTTRGERSDLDAPVARCRDALGDAVWGAGRGPLARSRAGGAGRVPARPRSPPGKPIPTGPCWRRWPALRRLTAAAAYVGGTLDAGGAHERAIGRCGDPAVAAPGGRARPQPRPGGGQRRRALPADGAAHPRQRRPAIPTCGLRGAGPGASQRGRLAEVSSRSRCPCWRWAFPLARQWEQPMPRCSRRPRPPEKRWHSRPPRRQRLAGGDADDEGEESGGERQSSVHLASVMRSRLRAMCPHGVRLFPYRNRDSASGCVGSPTFAGAGKPRPAPRGSRPRNVMTPDGVGSSAAGGGLPESGRRIQVAHQRIAANVGGR